MAHAHNLTPAEIGAADRRAVQFGSHLPPAFRAEAWKLNDAQIAELIGELLDMSAASPFQQMGEELFEALAPVGAAYRAAYGEIARVVEAQRYDPTDAERREASAAASADAFRPWERAA